MTTSRSSIGRETSPRPQGPGRELSRSRIDTRTGTGCASSRWTRPARRSPSTGTATSRAAARSPALRIVVRKTHHSQHNRRPMIAAVLLAQAMVYPTGDRVPTLEETRAKMGIASTGKVRGQLDAVGFASTAEQMKKTWVLSAEGPAPDRLGPAPEPGVLMALSPHD